MNKIITDQTTCPCCSGKKYGDCCQLIHREHSLADTPEKLMRSRYSAFVLNDTEHLLRTWASPYRPKTVNTADPALRWLRLSIDEAPIPPPLAQKGSVSFTATYLQNRHVYTLREVSNFIKVKGCWLYQEGETELRKLTVGRNSTCPCNSGKKFKRCCDKK